mmetsp:Transcript_11017/g.31605  ORF Transcript_11017/g.31605 Transcript_11017/m.31605 type:complete len:300 (+) Transcript_11017:3-902(+)
MDSAEWWVSIARCSIFPLLPTLGLTAPRATAPAPRASSSTAAALCIPACEVVHSGCEAYVDLYRRVVRPAEPAPGSSAAPRRAAPLRSHRVVQVDFLRTRVRIQNLDHPTGLLLSASPPVAVATATAHITPTPGPLPPSPPPPPTLVVGLVTLSLASLEPRHLLAAAPPVLWLAPPVENSRQGKQEHRPACPSAHYCGEQHHLLLPRSPATPATIVIVACRGSYRTRLAYCCHRRLCPNPGLLLFLLAVAVSVFPTSKTWLPGQGAQCLSPAEAAGLRPAKKRQKKRQEESRRPRPAGH